MDEGSQIFGNALSMERTEAIVRPDSEVQIAALTGAEGLGKRSFLLRLLEDVLEEPDRFVVDPDVDGARTAFSFLQADPLFSPYRAVVVDVSRPLSEPAQDAYLKLCEEPFTRSRVVFVLEDADQLLPALRSRIQEVVRWPPLGEAELFLFLNSLSEDEDAFARSTCCGIPALYKAMAGRPEFQALYSVVSEVVSGHPDPLSIPVPDVVISLSGKRSPERDAVSSVCRSACLQFAGVPSAWRRASAFLGFSSILRKHPASNAEVHWQRASVLCSM